MDAKKLSEELKEQFSRITTEERAEMDNLRAKMEDMGIFNLCGECPKDSGLSTPGQKDKCFCVKICPKLDVKT